MQAHPTEPHVDGPNFGTDENDAGVRAHTTIESVGREGWLGLTDDLESQRIEGLINEQLFGERSEVKIGTYRVTRRLGGGAMGEVFLCEHEALGRSVAVKRVPSGDAALSRLIPRLKNEARTLAQLNHENVVKVYDTGEDELSAYVVMEYVEGQDLRDWLHTNPPETKVLERMLAAGRGLAAVHEAGFVHRDFKPENVLIDSNGTVKVADFGLVLEERGVDRASRSDRTADPKVSRLTVDGQLIGTVEYMGPEQLRGEPASPRSDQFSYCLVLYEGLWHAPPFSSDYHSRLEQIYAGPPPPAGQRTALFNVIARGLHPDPERRWPSMASLLAALERTRDAPRRRRRIAAVLGLATVVVASLFAMFEIGRQHVTSCNAGLEGIWDDSMRAQFNQHVAELDASHVDFSAARVVAALDTWADDWQSEYGQACEQRQRERDVTRAELLAGRTDCLLRQAQQASFLIDGVIGGDASTLAEAVAGVDELPDPRACATDLAARGIEPPPRPAAAAVEALRSQLDQAYAARVLGDWEVALGHARAVERAATRLGYAPLVAEAQAELAMAEDVGGSPQHAAKLYDAAIHISEVERHDRLAAELLIERAELSLFELREFETAELRLQGARTQNERGGLSDDVRARLSHAHGRLAEHRHEFDAASKLYREALELARDDAPERATYLDALARVAEDSQTALPYRRRALEAAREHFGPRHPQTAKQLYNYAAAIQAALGHGGEAELDLAAEIWAETAPVSHRWRAKAEQLFAMQALRAQDFDAAEAHARAMATIYEAALVADDPEHGEPKLLLAQIYAMRADQQAGSSELREAAIVQATEALNDFRRTPGGRLMDPRITGGRLLLGNQQMMLGCFADAEREFDIVLAHAVARDPSAAIARLRLAELELRRRDLTAADRRLREVEAELKLIEAERPVYEILRGLVDVGLDCVTFSRRTDASTTSAFAEWIDQLCTNQSGHSCTLPDN
jgi:predicted Ser/Thr protein kinase/tetratricopeptide (TPR) repeat protein